MEFFASVGFILAAVLMTAVRALPPPKVYVGCYLENAAIPFFQEVAVGPLLTYNTTTPTNCATACLKTGYELAAMSEGIHCLCAMDPAKTIGGLTVSAGGCELLCSGEECGSAANTMLLTVYKTGGGSPNFTLNAATVDATAITVDVTALASGATFLVDYGYGSPLSYFNATPFVVDTYLVPGVYTVSIICQIEGTNLLTEQSVNLTKTNIASSVDVVQCPIVFEPDKLYYCNVSVTPVDDNTVFTATFDDTGTVFNIQGIGAEFYKLGNPPPRSMTTEVVAPGVGANVILLTDHPVAIEGLLIAYDIYAYATGAFSLSIKRPTCASGVYCVQVRGCMAKCPFDILANTHTCPAPQWLCPHRITCSGAAGAATCMAYEALPASWADVAVVAATVTAVGFHREVLAAPVPVLPGDVIHVTGPVGRKPATGLGGDKVDGVNTIYYHYIAAIIKENAPVKVSHICLTVNLDVTVTVVETVNTAATLANVTSCERNITDIAMNISQGATDAFDASLNIENPYYIRTITPATYTAIFSVAGPTTFTYTYLPDFGLNHTFIDTTDYPRTTTKYRVNHIVSVPNEGVYLVNISAQNKHNIIPGPVTNQVMLFAQHEVVTTWTVTPDSTTSGPGKTGAPTKAFKIPTQAAKFKFIDTAGANFPTNASARIDWGDGTPLEILGFVNPGDKMPILQHIYTKGNVYTMIAYIYNMVSGYQVTCDVLIIEEIKDFVIVNKYFPHLTSTSSRNGFGRIRNQFPKDKNLSFYPVMTQGTVDTYEVEFTNNQSQIFTFTVLDRFIPTADHFNYHFDIETFLNLTVYAVNIFERVPVDIFVEIVGQVRIAQIDDFAIITGKNELKTFEIKFESLGGGTCLVVDWGDTQPLALDSFGEETTCLANFSHASYYPAPILEIANNFTHTYTEDGVYNITAYAYNPVSITTDMLMFLVTSIKCRPPIVSIFSGTLDYLSAPQMERGEDNSIMSVATVNCSVTSKTKKRWQIYLIDSLWGNLIKPILTMEIIETWNMSEIIIPKLYLSYGHYMLVYTLTMWEPAVLDPKWPFQRQVETYIEIVKTPLIGVMFEGGVSRIIRGLIQQIPFEPAKYSIDPDFPDQKNFQVKWRCRQLGEAWPASDTTANPIWIKGTTGTGCFGHGPGLLDHKDPSLTVLGSDFLAVDKIYEMEVEISKDSRKAIAMGQVKIVSYVPPIIKVSCLATSLCKPDGTGVYVNPSVKMALVSECVDYCTEPFTHQWKVTDGNEVPYPVTTAHFPVGDKGPEFGISTQFYNDNPNVKYMMSGVESTDPAGAIGGAIYFMKVNMRPVGGTCVVTEPATRLALVDIYKIECRDWVDPEQKGIAKYVAYLVAADGTKKPLTEIKFSSVVPQITDLILPPGVFNVMVDVYDKWDAFTIYTAKTAMEVLMPTKEQVDAANIAGQIAALAGAGNTALLTMMIAAQTAVAAQAPWLSLKEEDIKNLSREELDARLIYLANMNNAALDAIMENTNYNSLEKINAAASAVAGMLDQASKNLEAYKTIDMDGREKVGAISEKLLKGMLKCDIPSSDLLLPLTNYMATIAGGMALGQTEAGSDETCNNAPPNDVRKADNLPFDTRVTGIDMVIPDNPLDIMKCNVRDVTKERAARLVPLIEDVLDHVTETMMGKMLVGEAYNMSTPNGVHLKMALVMPKLRWIPIGNAGGGFGFSDSFCPQINCHAPLGYSCREWPFITHAYAAGSDNLAPGTKILDLILYDRKMTRLKVEDLKDDIITKVPRTAGKMGNGTLPEFEYVNASVESPNQLIPTVYTTFNVTKNESSVNLEIKPITPNPRLFVMVSKPRLPTPSEHQFFSLVKDLPVKNGTHEWFFPPNVLNGTGRYFVGIGEFKPDFNIALMKNPKANNVTGKVLQNVTTDYYLRIFTSGCFFFNKTKTEWQSSGVKLINSDHLLTTCNTSHLTSFGSGMFVMPNTIDFNYVFANMGFSDNLTIYLTLIVSLTIFALLMIWARIKDKKDVEKLGATPLPDNKAEDKYCYEVLVFTGNVKGAQTDSVVQFIVSGDEDETDVRTFADSKRKILRKDSVDVFVMAVERPLGPLQFLRIWHDNSGKGPNASWYLSYIVFRDVQTGDKYEFICNQWLAVEYDDGQIDRLIQVAGREQRTQFKHLFNTTKNKKLADGHLWFSVFLRPARSRFTRCQRVASCFALLFLSMLVNAMWYERVPEQPGAGGLNIGPFSLSPEQMGVGIMSNLIVFPPSFLIIFLFRKSRPRVLRKSRIEIAVEQTKAEQGVTEDEDGTPRKVLEKKQRKKKFTIPWWGKIIAWILVFVCILVSVFFLLMYGVMFGNSKATKWVTSLVISFFTSVLFVQPLKIFLTTMVLSAICKAEDLDEDDADEDEEDPNLDQDEMWLHKGEKSEKCYKQRKIDSDTLRMLRAARKKEVEMWAILKEIFYYAIFLWILLILSYGNRDPNAFYLQQNLKNNFLNEGIDGADYTLVHTSDDFWRYLYTGFMTNLRADKMYNNKPPYGLRGFLNDWSNRIMGYATMRQIRVNERSCRVAQALDSMSFECSGYANLIREDAKHYCLGWVKPTNATKNTPACEVPEYRYETAAQLNSLPIWGQLDWYGGGGYVVHLKDKTEDIYKKFRQLQKNKWIDSKTRAIIIEFSAYNAQVNLFGMATIMAEFTPGGGITHSTRFEGIRLLQHHNNFGFFIIACEVAYCLFVVYFTVKEVRLFRKQRKHYFDSYWAYAEIAILIACYLAILFYILRYVATKAVLKVFKRTYGNGYVKLQYAASLDEIFGYLVAFIVFVGTLKFSKLLRFNKRIGVLSATLHQCWDDLSGFLIAFFLCFFSFVFMFYVQLSMLLEDFFSFIKAIETCFSMMLGKFQFEEMKEASFMVPIMFFIFVLFNSWVLINLLLTLVIKAFQEVKYDILKQPNEYEMVSFVWERFRTFLGLGGNVQALPTLQTTVRTNMDESDPDKVTELPNKVDKFLDYLNQVYFSGSLDVNNRDALKSSFYNSQFGRKASGMPDYNDPWNTTGRFPGALGNPGNGRGGGRDGPGRDGGRDGPGRDDGKDGPGRDGSGRDGGGRDGPGRGPGGDGNDDDGDDFGFGGYNGNGRNGGRGGSSSRGRGRGGGRGGGRFGGEKDGWHGAIDGGKRGVRNRGGSDDDIGGPKYEGPRITNKFQADLDDF